MPNRVTTRVRSTLQIAWRVLLFLLVFSLIAALVFVPTGAALEELSQTSPMRVQLFVDIAAAAAMLAATWLMTRFVDRRRLWTIGFEPGKAVRDVLVGLALGGAWILLSIVVAWAAGWASYQAPEGFSGSRLAVAATSVLFNVLTQQLLLCGFIFQTIRTRANFVVALLVCAAMFSVIHAGAFAGAWIPAVNVFAAGMLFCLAYGATGNLWLPAAMHFSWNLALGPLLGLTVSGSGELGLGWSVFILNGPAHFTGGAFGLEGGLVVSFTTTLFILAAAWWHRRSSTVPS